MKYIKQFLIIITISFIGEGLNYILPLPIPASIYGFVILLTCLHFKIIKVHQVKETAMFLIDIMPIMFIAPAVGLMDSFVILKPIFIPVIIITLISTIIVMGFSAKATEIIISKKEVK